MKLSSLVQVVICFSSWSAMATSPEPPFVPKEAYQYSCGFRVEKTQADSSKRYSGIIAAATLVEKNPFNSAVDLERLNWKSLSNTSNETPLKIKADGISVALEFERIGNKTLVILSTSISQESESKLYQLNSFKNSKAPFDVGGEIEVEANVEERANWINNQPPSGLLMSSTSVKVTCVRTK